MSTINMAEVVVAAYSKTGGSVHDGITVVHVPTCTTVSVSGLASLHANKAEALAQLERAIQGKRTYERIKSDLDYVASNVVKLNEFCMANRIGQIGDECTVAAQREIERLRERNQFLTEACRHALVLLTNSLYDPYKLTEEDLLYVQQLMAGEVING